MKRGPSASASAGQALATWRARLRASALEVARIRSGSNPVGAGPPATNARTSAACWAARRARGSANGARPRDGAACRRSGNRSRLIPKFSWAWIVVVAL